MKKYFYFGALGLLIFEILNVYFIMPMPGSQNMNSLDLAYFLYSWRWAFRSVFGIMLCLGITQVFRSGRKWIPAITLLCTTVIVYLFNFKMSADHMFMQAKNTVFKSQADNQLPGGRLVIGVENNGEARAYPIQFLAYHHQVRDTIGGKPVMVTYCSVCRTGRVYEPLVNGKPETFRLVGMDHYNAMFEDANTGSWWRQSTGEAVEGRLKGKTLPEIYSQQMTVDKWFEMYPQGKVMQADESSVDNYDPLARFEAGKSLGNLTRTDSLSWKDKSWVLGIQRGNLSKAYNWNDLKKKRIINDVIGQTPVVMVIATDGKCFAAFERPSSEIFTINHDTLFSGSTKYNFSGRNIDLPSNRLQPVNAYQEFWHSWKTFHPHTQP